MAKDFEPETIDWNALYRQERHREPVRQLCPGIDRHFQWEASNDQYKIPIDWLSHYASAFHFSDAEIWAARTTDDMPAASGVYFLFDGDECIYVGQTQCFRDRAEQHKRNEIQWTSHAYFEVPKSFAPAVEAYYIRRIAPWFNGSIPNDRTFSVIVDKLGLDRTK
jgi:hypothetical protein